MTLMCVSIIVAFIIVIIIGSFMFLLKKDEREEGLAVFKTIFYLVIAFLTFVSAVVEGNYTKVSLPLTAAVFLVSIMEMFSNGMDFYNINKNKSQEFLSKSYKLKREVVDQFAEACDKAGVSQASQLTKMMTDFIEEQNKQ